MHQNAHTGTDTWLTPKHIIDSLGEFDLDPCTPIKMPWKTAKHRFTIDDDGLKQKWFGRVWLNPPYSNVNPWLDKMAIHFDGIALLSVRTDTKWFHNYIWAYCTSIFFFEGRIRFYKPNGTLGHFNAGVGSVLVSYGKENMDAIEEGGFVGKHLPVNWQPIIVVGITPKWYAVVSMAAKQFGDRHLKPIYDMVERIAPDKVKNNPNWKAKIRQQLQVYRKTSNSIIIKY